MQHNLSTHDPAHLVSKVRQIIRDRAGLASARTLFEIRQLLEPSDWQDTGSGPGCSREPAVAAGRPGHRAWCTDHLSEDPSDPLTEGADECGAVVRVLEPRDRWQAVDVTVSQGPADPEPVMTVESYSRPMTLLEVERLYAELGRALELARRA